MSNIHFILQNKGGIGKTLISVLLAQYLESKGQKPLCVDLDPANRTFFSFEALKVKTIDIVENDEIAPELFDNLIELIAEIKTDMIIDNGSSSFIPFSNYLITQGVIEMIESLGHRVIIHSVLVGDQSLIDTVHGFGQLAESMDTGFIIWLNNYFGKLINNEGLHVREFKVLTDNVDKIVDIIEIPKEQKLNEDCLAKVLKSKLTFEEAIKSSDFKIMEKQRVKMIKTKLFELFDQSDLAIKTEPVATKTKAKAKTNG